MDLGEPCPFIVVCFNEFVVDVDEDKVSECCETCDVAIVLIFKSCMVLKVLLVL